MYLYVPHASPRNTCFHKNTWRASMILALQRLNEIFSKPKSLKCHKTNCCRDWWKIWTSPRLWAARHISHLRFGDATFYWYMQRGTGCIAIEEFILEILQSRNCLLWPFCLSPGHGNTAATYTRPCNVVIHKAILFHSTTMNITCVCDSHQSKLTCFFSFRPCRETCLRILPMFLERYGSCYLWFWDLGFPRLSVPHIKSICAAAFPHALMSGEKQVEFPLCA
jgi:hypothetical protein